MAVQNDNNAIDELFRKTFDDLPDNAAASGWDTPSDQVWQQVADRIQIRQTGWSAAQRWLAITAIGVTVALAVYLYNNNVSATAAQPAAPTAVTAPATPTAPAPAVAAAQTVATSAPTTATEAPVNHRQLEKETRQATSISTVAPPAPLAESPVVTQTPAVNHRQLETSTPTAKPHDKPVLNSTERAKLKAQKEAALWKTVVPSLQPRETQTRVQEAFRSLLDH